jgi:SAM-dependent methyltransferase
MRILKSYKTFEDVQQWDNFHTLKSQNPNNPQLVYERDVETYKIDKLLYDLEPDARVLDLGCGDGVDSMYISSKGFNVSALDLSTVVIDENKEKDPNIDWLTYDISDANLPYSEGEFDLIYCRLSLHYFTEDELENILKDIRNKLKIGGLLYFTVKTQNLQDKIKTGKQFLHKRQWLKLLSPYFNDINVLEYSGKLYNIPSNWLEFECL